MNRIAIATMVLCVALVALPAALATPSDNKGKDCPPVLTGPLLLKVDKDKDCNPCDEKDGKDLQTTDKEGCNPCEQKDGLSTEKTKDCPPPPCDSKDGEVTAEHVDKCPPTPPTEIPFFPSAGSLVMGLLGAAGSVGAIVLRRR